ncbi:hypothetical protein [Janibacter melonis]|uniref:hypothetical protein n=1 Tax=Janibacter melonis TaxID=262209 RepID=UPI00174E8022|nr:hypothetical protein [Janibacter melonis]
MSDDGEQHAVAVTDDEQDYEALDPWEEWGAAGRKDEGLLWCAICYALLPPHARLVRLHVRQHPEGRGR